MTVPPRIVDLSKWLSWALRHDPTAAGITLDAAGWCDIDAVLAAAARAGRTMTMAELSQVVSTSDKKRFALSDGGHLIRANQGHSVPVELGLAPQAPPHLLFHGTADRFVAAIRTEGLKRQARHHVHLSADRGTATSVGVRHGRPVVLVIAAGRMHADGHLFYRSENVVWLVEAVPPAYLGIEE